MVDTIDDDTVLFVIGDHGMTRTGKLEYCFVRISVCAHICSSVTLYGGFLCIAQNINIGKYYVHRKGDSILSDQSY